MSNLKSSKLLEENIWEDLQGLEVGKDSSERTLKAQMIKKKKKNWQIGLYHNVKYLFT